MAHKLITGQTLSGKSTLARAIVADASARHIVPVIYDPTLSPDWKSDFVTDDYAEFVSNLSECARAGLPIFAVVDEADTVLSQGDRDNWWLFTRGRHFGIEACAITQRPQLVAPTVRGQCADVFVFHLGKNDASFLSEDVAAPDIQGAPTLRQGEFYRVGWRDGRRITDKLKIF